MDTLQVFLHEMITSVLDEGVMDNLTTQISRVIVNHLKRAKDWGNIPEFRAEIGDLLVVAKFNPGSHLSVLNGVFSPLSKRVLVTIGVPEVPDLKQLNEFIPLLKNTLRHELEHYRQDQRPGADLDQPKVHGVTGPLPGYKAMDREKGGMSSQGAEQYFLHPTEVEAYVMGAYKEAKTRKEPLGKVLARNLSQIYAGLVKGLGAQEAMEVAKKIQTAWMNYVQVRLPNMVSNPQKV